jgi:hypothetical protein
MYLQSLLEVAEANSTRLTSELRAAEELLHAKDQELQAVQLKLDSTCADLSKVSGTVTDRETKVSTQPAL